ncbi:MAG: S9 family peptidase [Bacteroidia bacterium]|nr:S9 family peptidase [Bacteroidia bacterium]
MIRNLKLIAALILMYAIALPTAQSQNLEYPSTTKTDQVDDYFGVEVQDPYRWLEDDQSDETAAWVTEQNKLTFGYLNQLEDRSAIAERLTQIWNYPKYGTPWKDGDHYFYFLNNGVQNQSVLYYSKSLSEDAKVFIDPNKFSDDGTISLTSISVSNDGKFMGYGISKGGSDWNEYFIKDIETNTLLKDHLKWIKFSGMAWEGNGFYYNKYPEPAEGTKLSAENESMQIYYHKVGDDQANDRLIYEDKEHPKRYFGASVSDDERFLIISGGESTSGNDVQIRDLNSPSDELVRIVSGFDSDFNFIGNVGNDLYFSTNNGASKNRIIKIDFANPKKENWKDVIAESDDLLQSVRMVGGKFVTVYLKDASSRIKVFNKDGQFENDVKLPGIGTAGLGRTNKTDTEVFFSHRSFTSPSAIYRYDLASKVSSEYLKPELAYNPDDYTTKQVFYKSKDGTKIPMFITHKKGIELDGNNPTLLYGYGGFDISITPSYRTENIIFLEQGGIYASANMRGGGEYGKEWHDAGTKLQKQNVFDDFIAGAEYLIANKYTNSSKLAISGRSNGGLLVGACMTQRPDLYRVALPAVGVMDMLRFHKFTIGWAWTGDYGSSDNEDEFKALYAYSPLHNIKKGVSYPATMVTTADHDDRVVPAHSFKFISELQDKHEGDLPVLIRIDVKAGHGAGKPTSMKIAESADIFAFVFHHLGMKYQATKQ